MTARSAGLVRALKLLAFLRDGRRTVHDMAREFQVTPRTICRDLAALQEAHVPVRKLQDPEGKTARWTVR